MDQLARAIRLSVRPLETGIRPLKTALFSACLSVLTHAAYADVIQGSSSSETLNGTSSDDTFQLVSGANGFDAFNGGAGQDLIQGTALDDIIGITSLSDIETIDGGDGFDTLQAPGGQNAAIDLTNITVSNIEEIRGGTSNDTIKGSQSADVIIGGAGRDNIYGNGGDDTFYLSLTDVSPDNYDGGDGYDSIIGTAGDDVMYISTLLANMELIDGLVGFNVIQAINGTNQGINLTGITVNNIDELRGGTSQDTIRGSEGHDRIIGGLGRDTLYGNGGDDTFVLTFGDTRNDYDGGAGFDTIVGTASDDILYTNVFFRDIERIDGGDGYNVVQAINGTNQAINFENVELINIHELRGGTSQDTIKGSQGGEIIAAGTGTDVVWGYSGNDTYRYIAGDGRDTFYNTGATAADTKTLDIQDVSSTDLTFSRESDDLVIALLQANDSIRIKHWYADTNQRMDQITTIDNSISPEDAENAVLNGGILDGGSSSSSASSSSSSSSSSGSVNQPPVFQSATQVDINTSPEIHQVQATDPDGDAITFSLASGPDGLSINATTGMLYWVSPPLGEYVIIVEASDGINVASSHTLILNIHVEPNVAPVAENGVIAIDEDNIANFALVATDDNNDPLTHVFVSQPSHGQLSGTAPNIIYTPVEDYFGMDSFSFKVNDGTLDSDVATVTINITPVNDQPSIISIPLDNTKSNMSYIYQLEVNDIDSESHLTYQLLTGPEGLTINPNTGLVEWFPSDFAIGDHNIILQVTDDGGLSDTQAYTLTVEANNHAPFALNQNENVDEDNALNIVLTAGDIDNDVLTYTILTQPMNGQLTGTAPNLIYTPAENFNGQDSFTYQVNDGQLDSGIATVTIDVASVNDSPAITSVPVTAIDVGDNYSYQVLSSDVDDGDSSSYSLLIQPAGMSINASGLIQWLPTSEQLGDVNVTVQVEDAAGATDTQNFVITVTGNVAPQIISSPVTSVTAGEQYTYDTEATDANGDNLTYRLDTAPNGMTIDSQTGLIAWSPVNRPDYLLYQDDFNDGETAPWYDFNDVESQAIGIIEQKIYRFNGRAWTGQKSWSNYTYEADFNFDLAVRNDAGVIGYYQDENNYYQVTFSETLARLYRTINGSQIEISNAPVSIELGVWYTVKMEFSDAVLTVYLDDNLIFEDDNVLLDHGAIGLYSGYYVLYDNVSVTPEGYTGEPGDVGVHDVLVVVQDENGEEDSQAFALTVESDNIAPTIVSSPVSIAAPNSPYEYQVQIEDKPNDIHSYSLINSPSGMSIDPQYGLISWIAPDDQPGTVSGGFTSTNGCVDDPCTIYETYFESDTRLMDMWAYDLYNHRNVLSDGLLTVGDHIFSNLSVPQNYTFETSIHTRGHTKVFVGFLAQDLLNYYIIEFSISPSDVASVVLSRVMNRVGEAVFDANISLTQADFDNWLDIKVTVDDGRIYAWLNAELVLDIAHTPAFYGPPIFLNSLGYDVDFLKIYQDVPANTGFTSDPATYSVSVVVEDQEGLSAQQDFDIRMTEENTPPAIYSIPQTQVVLGNTYAYEIKVFDNNFADTFELSFEGPAGMQLIGQTLEWSPVDLGEYPISVTVTDSQNAQYTQDYTLQVVSGNLSVRQGPANITETESLYQGRLFMNEDGELDLVYELLSAPEGMTINGIDGVLDWTPEFSEAGVYDISIRVSTHDGVYLDYDYQLQVVEDNKTPSITSLPPTSVSVNEEYFYRLTAFDRNSADALAFEKVAGPLNLNLDVNSGVVTWVPTYDDVGAHVVIFRVTDGAGAEALQTYTLDVHSDSGPRILSQPVLSGAEEELYRYTVYAEDANPLQTLTYCLDSAPGGMVIDPVTGEISWQVPSADNRFVEIDFDNLEEAEVLTNQYPGVRFFSWDLDGLPGNIFGENRSDDRYTFSDKNTIHPGYYGNAYDITFDWGVEFDQPANYFFLRVLDAEESIIVRVYYQDILVKEFDPGVGGNDGYNLEFGSVNGTLLFDKVVIDTGGAGPEYYDNFKYHVAPKVPVTACVTNESQQKDSQSFEIDISTGNLYPFITSEAIRGAQVGEEYHVQVEAVDPEGDVLTYSLEGAPASLTIDPTTGLIFGVPEFADIGDYIVRVQVSDGNGGYANQEFILRVREENQPPVFTNAPERTIYVGDVFSYWMRAYDPEGSSVGFSVQGMVEGMHFDGVSGRLVWTPKVDDIGVYDIVLEAQDEQQQVSQFGVRLTVLGDNRAPRITSSPQLIAYTDEAYVYHVNALDSDVGAALGYTLSVAPVGMSIDPVTGVISWSPSLADLGQYSVTIVVSDEQGETDEQHYTLTVRDDNAVPSIVSLPIYKSVVNAQYEYQVQATDPNTSDTLTYSLDDAPANMTIDAVSGLLSWQPDVSGVFNIIIRAEDNAGAYTRQIFDLTVEEDVTAPVLNVHAAPQPVFVGDELMISIEASDNSGIANVTATFDGAPLTLDANYDVVTVPSQPGLLELNVEASDVNGNNSVDVQNITVLEDVDAPTVQVTTNHSVIGLGDTLILTVDANDNRGIATVGLTVNGQALALDDNHQATFAPITLDDLTIVASATDVSGLNANANAFVTVSSDSDNTDPFVQITSPDIDTTLTNRLNIVGSVDDVNLASYEVKVSSKGHEQWIVIGSGTTNISDAVLAELDPSVLTNGQYDVVLTAVDSYGNEALASTSVLIEGGLKVGNFSFTVEDLNIPLAGIPIQVTRTYDSRRRHEDLDFGYGWTIDYQNVKIEESRVPGAQWSINEYSAGDFNEFIYLCVEPNGKPIISITLPNGDVEKFEVTAQPDCNFYHVDLNVSLKFTAIGDTQSTLQTSDFNAGRMWNGEEIRTPEGDRLLDFQKYVLTTKAGYIYHLDQDFGIEHVIDPNGYTLTYTDEGIFHSSGKAIFFERDALGHITEVIAPSGEKLIYSYDANGDLNTVTDRDTAVTTYTYNNNHGLLEIFDPLNRKIVKNIYDDEGRLTSQEDGDGNIKIFNHDLDAKTSLVTDRDGRSTLYEYDDRGNVLFETQLIGDGSYGSDIVTSYTYDANDNQTTKTIGTSVWQSVFDDKNNQLSATDPEDNTVYYSDYNGRGQEGTIEDELGRIHTMSYDVAGNLYRILGPEVTDPDTGEVTRPLAGNIINAKGLVNSTTDMRGFTTSYTYYESGNGEGLKHTESNDIIGTITYTYDANNNVTSEQRERTVNGVVVQEVMTYEYDTRDRLIKTIYPDTTYTQTVYDLAGNMDKERDRFGNWTDYTYDAYGRLTHTLYPDGSEETRTYTQEGLLHTVTDQSGMVTRNKYDDAGRLWKVHNDTAGTYTETQYTEQGWVHNEWDENRNRTEYVYDRAGRRTDVIRHYTDDQGQAATQQHSFTYYANGELHTETDANNHTTTYILNALDQRIETRFENTTVTKQRFDAMGTRIASIDQENRKTRFDYDDSGRLEGVTPEVQINGIDVPTTSYTYDEVGNKLTQTDANGHTTTWTYDYFGRVLTRTLPEGQQESFNYATQPCAIQPATTPAGEPAALCEVHTQTDFNGDTITTVMDSMGRVDTMTYSKDGRVESYTYYPNGQTKTATTPEGTTEYFYDNRNRLEREVRPTGETMGYDYDDVGNRTLVKVTRNNVVTSQTSYTYDGLNRLKAVTNDLAPTDVTAYTYDPVGNLDTVTYANGMVTDYNYNSINQLTDVITRDGSGVVVGHFNYGLDATGRREVITELDGRSTAYCYDELYRLTDETIYENPLAPITQGCISDSSDADYVANYQYDMVGNREAQTINGTVTNYTYDMNDRLESAGSIIYSYDDNGNTLSENDAGVLTTYIYDGRNKLSSVDKNGTSTSYTYNHNGIRNSKTESGVTTLFIVDENRDYAQVLEEIVNGSIEVSYIHGHDLINQNRNGIDATYYHYDGLGSARALTDSAGLTVKEYDYAAFGELINESGSVENVYLFTGEQFDDALNQYYLRARYYDQSIGRLTQMDTWMGLQEDPISLHKYLYANVDPANMIDPSGNITIGGLMTGIGNVATLATRAQTAYSVFQVATGEAQMSAGQVATHLLINMLPTKFVTRFLKNKKGPKPPKLSSVGLLTKIKLRFTKFKPTQSAKRFDIDYINDLAKNMKKKDFSWGSKKIVVDRNNHILDGHHHFVAAKKAGIKIPKSALYVSKMDNLRPVYKWLEVIR